jgi:hypothetical protein
MTLRDTQVSFATSLLAGDATAAAQIHAGKLTPSRRLEIYRHNVFANLRGVLKDIYPVILAIVGDDFFQHAADQFVGAYPSRSGDLNQFGSEWAAFLSTYPHAAELPYLADVARLEWAWHEVFHAGDAAPLDLARLAAIPPSEHGALCMVLHPSIRLINSEFPIARIWEVNQPKFAEEIKVDWDVPPERLLIRRDMADGVSVVIERITKGGAAFLQALQQHATLKPAAEAALNADAAFDLPKFLLESVQSGVIVDFAA